MKTEEAVGYVLLVAGLSVIVYSVLMDLSILSGRVSMPQLIYLPTGIGEIGVMANTSLAFSLLVVVAYAGSILLRRGLRLFRKASLKTVKESSGEELRIIKK